MMTLVITLVSVVLIFCSEGDGGVLLGFFLLVTAGLGWFDR